MQKESTVAMIMNFIVSGYVYFVAFTLVLFMISSLVAGVLGLVSQVMTMVSQGANVFLTTAEDATLQANLLHTIAFTIVLVKAYKILISYAQTRQINIKFIVEIAIVGSTIELIFNAQRYDQWATVLLAAFAFLNLLAYLYFYSTLKKASEDHVKDIAKQREVNSPK